MRGEKIKSTLTHDAGAFGRCSYCGRYSDNPSVLLERIACDCGKSGGWSGSFRRPTLDSLWSSAALRTADGGE
jgi:hypothetical protein